MTSDDISHIITTLDSGKTRNLEVDGCPLKENLFGQSTLLMNVTYIVFPLSDL